ncbi:hypothetical protein B834_871 [Enterococcus mundtii 1A]|uniref:hypothetical protein n=1 Tax=Enterococcus mundtii TaxID=53346 RepID=UPI00230206C7|nr:hypothetical protein [Enterococcus mundtii]MDA9428401.1 hypothetical protein [Enterococcus mundtii 1A]
MKKCPICEKVFRQFEDVVEIESKFYHEGCLEIVPVKFCAYNPNEDDYENFIGQFDPDDKSWVSDMMDDGDYLKEKRFKVSYTNVLIETGEIETIEIFALDAEEAKERWSSPFRRVLNAEEIED